MNNYQYPIEECDIPSPRRSELIEYRELRTQCLELLAGSHETTIINQILNLTWHTLTFKTLNEALRIDPSRELNGAMWDLITEGYASITMLGVRKLVDRDKRNNSLKNLVSVLREKSNLLTRENFVCFDGLPYDFEEVQINSYTDCIKSNPSKPRWLASSGPKAWGESMFRHEQFDKFMSPPFDRHRSNLICESHFKELEKKLNSPVINRVRLKVNQQIAHTPKADKNKPKQIPKVTFNDIDDALKNLIQIGHKIAILFFDGSFSSPVAIPQFDVLKGLDNSWSSEENMTKLDEYWRNCTNEIESWVPSK